jgi:hypothetical protein
MSVTYSSVWKSEHVRGIEGEGKEAGSSQEARGIDSGSRKKKEYIFIPRENHAIPRHAPNKRAKFQ